MTCRGFLFLSQPPDSKITTSITTSGDDTSPHDLVSLGSMKETHASTEDHEEPERYEIRLKGYLDERWAARFESLNFTHESDGTTILCGPVVDQAELHGLLRKVRDLGMTLISVIRVESCQAEVIGPFKLTKKGKEKDCESRESKFRGDFYESN